MSKKHPIYYIDFEGLDCSFKETNAKKLAEYLGETAKVYSFPRYNTPSCYYIENYLSGKYPRSLDSIIPINMFMLEMYDVWWNEIVPDINNGIDYVIFDRYWYSNLYYQAGNTKLEKYIIDFAKKLALPECNAIIKLIPHMEAMLDFVRKKNSTNDIIESDEERLCNTYKKFVDYEFPVKTFSLYTTKLNDKSEIVIKSENEIFRDILSNLYHNSIL